MKNYAGPSQNLYLDTDPRAKEKHRGILRMLILDMQPFSVVDDLGFVCFCHAMDCHNIPPTEIILWTDNSCLLGIFITRF